MKLDSDIELIEGLPIAYIKSINSVVVSDLHLGYESRMAIRGVFIPKVNLKKIIKELGKALKIHKAKSIIVVGDIKNDFSNVGQDEYNELFEIIKLCKEKEAEWILIKGNHDNFIDRYKGPFNFKTYTGEAQIGDYLFFHGDKLPKIPDKRPKMLIAGHEHPSIGIVNAADRNERLRCFLIGEYKSIKLLVLPAISYFATGSDINHQPKSRIMSSVLRKIDIGKMHAIAIGYDSTLDFGTIENLKKLDYK